MVFLIHQMLIILHIITAAAWFGLGLRLPSQARAAAEAEGGTARTLFRHGEGTVKLMSIMMVLTIIFAYAVFFVGGGFGGYPPSIHISFTLILVLAAIHFFVIRPGWQQLDASEKGSEADLSAGRKKVAIGTGVGHLLWLVLLVLMFWPRISVVL